MTPEDRRVALAEAVESVPYLGRLDRARVLDTLLPVVDRLCREAAAAELRADWVRLCDHGYAICAPCGHVPPSWQARP